MYQNNNSFPGHAEYFNDSEHPARITSANNSVKSSNNFNTMGEEFYGNHFRQDGFAGALGGYAVDVNGFLNDNGRKLLKIVYLLDGGSKLGPYEEH